MKYILILFLLSALNAVAQTNDTTAYNLQRLKINSLLAARSAKFGQYDVSLNARTGIFGFQTKADIRNSNEILRQIALNDNEIFRELKVLMDYKDMQAQQIRSNATETNSRMQLYRQTIKKLQDQNELLSAENNSFTKTNTTKSYFITFLLFCLMAMGYLFYKKFRNTGSFMR